MIWQTSSAPKRRLSGLRSRTGCGDLRPVFFVVCFAPTSQAGVTRRFNVKWQGGSHMEQAELLRHVCEILEELGLPYLVTGAQATIAFGEPRFTNDIDIVVALTPDRLD